MTRALVLLASHNGESVIEEQIVSILGQQRVAVEIVIGDDVSRDSTRTRIHEAFGHDPRVRLIGWEKASGSAGANFLRLMRAVNASTFDVVALSDQDDIWFPDKISAGAAALGNANAAGYSAAVLAQWDDGRKSVLSQVPHIRRADFLFEGAGQGCTFVLRRSFFERVQQFLCDDRITQINMHFHDWMLYVVSRAWGERWVFDPIPRMVYRQHAGNDIGARGDSTALFRRFRMIRQGWYSVQIGKACDLYSAAGGGDKAVLDLAAKLSNGPARGRLASAGLAVRLLRDGRRRAADRMMLFVAALFRWI